MTDPNNFRSAILCLMLAASATCCVGTLPAQDKPVSLIKDFRATRPASSAMLWSVADNHPIEASWGKQPDSELKSVGFAETDKTVWLAYANGVITLKSLTDPQKCLPNIDCGRRISGALVNSSLSTILLTRECSGAIERYDVQSGLSTWMPSGVAAASLIAFQRNQDYFTLGSVRKTYSWPSCGTKQRWTLTYDVNMMPLAITPDGGGVLFFDLKDGVEPDALQILDGRTGESTWSMPAESLPLCAQSDTTGKSLVTGDGFGIIAVRSVSEKRTVQTWKVRKSIRSVDAAEKAGTICAQLSNGDVVVVKLGQKSIIQIPRGDDSGAIEPSRKKTKHK